MDKHRSRPVSLPAALMIVFVSLGAFVGTAKLVAPDKHFGLTSFSFADEGSDDGGDDGKESDNDNEEDKSDSGDDQDKAEEKAKKETEKRKKEAEKQREDLKKSARSASVSVKMEDEDASESESDDLNGDEVQSKDDEDENEADSSQGMYKEKDKTLEKLSRDLDKAEEDIMKQAEKGANVSLQLAALAQYREQLNAVGGAFDGNNLDTAKVLAKQIRKEAYFLKKDAQDTEHVADEMENILKRFAQTESKLAELDALGGDSASLRAALATLKVDYAVLQETISTTPDAISRETVKAFEKKVKRVKSLAESALYALGGDDDELGDDHEDESDDIAEHLLDVAEVEDGDHNGVSDQVRTVATSQKIAAKTVKSALGDFEKRSRVTEFFLGTDQEAAARLTAEVGAMQSRAMTLEMAAAALTDADMKQILLDQATALRNEAAKLSTYLDAQNAGFSLFGWLFQ